MDLALPPALAGVETSDWDSIPPEDLLRDPSRVASQPSRLAGARALRYARAGTSMAYDEIGFRMLAASLRGPITLQTLPSMRLERAQQERTRANLPLEEVRSQVPKLRHRPLELPRDGRFRYEIVDNLINITRISDAGRDASQDVWTFSLSDPPEMILQLASGSDEPPNVSQQYRVDLPGIFWLPLAALIRTGRFERMQECRQELIQQISADCYYCFLSHRWLSPTHPDPEAAQARYAAWQIVGHLCEAIRVADRRGLSEARKFSALLGVAVGISGPGLAEALLGDVLRPALDEHSLAGAVAEVASLGDILDDYGVGAARDDIGLRRLSALLVSRPIVRALLDKIYLWYDYSCLAQPPREEADESLFRKGLDQLNFAQMVGRTAILLDETEDYLSRAWCALEAVTTDTLRGVAALR